MNHLETDFSQEIKIKVLNWLSYVHAKILRADLELSRNLVGGTVKETQKGRFYVYKDNVSRRASAEEVSIWARRRKYVEQRTELRQELTEIYRHYRALRLPYISSNIAKILTELDSKKMLGRTVYVLGDLANLAHKIKEQHPAKVKKITGLDLKLLILNPDVEYHDHAKIDLDPESRINELIAENRCWRWFDSTSTAISLMAREDKSLRVDVYCIDKVGWLYRGMMDGDAELLSDDAFKALRSWRKRQQEDADRPGFVVILDSNGSPVPIITPGLEVTEILNDYISDFPVD